MNLLTKSIDITDYVVNSKIEKIAEFAESLSSQSRAAHIPSYEELSDLKETDFAVALYSKNKWQMNKFAMHNKELTELNINLLSNTKDSLPAELLKVAASNLTCAAKHYDLNIPENLQEYTSEKYMVRKLDVDTISTEISKVANVTPEVVTPVYAVNSKYPIHTRQLLIKAAHWFDANNSKLSLDESSQFITNFVKQAESLNYNYNSSDIFKLAQYDSTEFNPDYKLHITIRKKYIIDNDDSRDMINTINSVIEKSAEFGPEKTAALVELIDSDLGIQGLYGSKIFSPREAVYKLKKVASINIDGNTITNQDLKALDDYDLTSIVGSEGATELKGDQGLEVLASLPTPIKKEVIKKITGK